METTNTTETPQVDTVSASKPKRAYKKKEKMQEVAAPVAPVAPVRTAAMDKLEAEILEIVAQRSAANNALRNAKMTAEQAQLQLKGAQEFLFSLEQEVNYRMTLLGQLRGDRSQSYQTGTMTPVASPSFDPYAAPTQLNQNFASISSTPAAPPAGIEVVGGRRVRSEDAVAMRAML